MRMISLRSQNLVYQDFALSRFCFIKILLYQDFALSRFLMLEMGFIKIFFLSRFLSPYFFHYVCRSAAKVTWPLRGQVTLAAARPSPVLGLKKKMALFWHAKSMGIEPAPTLQQVCAIAISATSTNLLAKTVIYNRANILISKKS